MPRIIEFYVHDGYQLLDLAGPLSAFEAANGVAGEPLYSFRLTSRNGGNVRGSAGTSIMTSVVRAGQCDTIIVMGGSVEQLLVPEEVRAFVRAAKNAVRIASVCTGAFLLAEAGLLDGRRATTHWARARDFQKRYPSVKVEPDRVFVADQHIWTSAGITAGIDLALALIETDQGLEISRAVARQLVVYHRRPGGQSQFSTLAELEPASDRIRLALSHARDHLAEPLPLERLAEAARLSPRQFGRLFRLETGETPARAVERLRVEAARLRLQEGAEPIETVAQIVGFNDPERMRRAFVKRFGHSPQAMRQISRARTCGN